MKGQFFSGPLSFALEVEGETWYQGQMIKGIFTIANQGKEELGIDFESLGVSLGFGDLKKVHADREGAIKKISSVNFPSQLPQKLKALEELKLPFEFSLEINCSITDKKSSYFLIYGLGEKQSHLQLLVYPLPLLKQIADCVESFYRFKLKEAKSAKKGVSFKFKPPSSRELANVEALDLILWFDQQELCVEFNFDTKKIDMSSVSKGLVKTKTQYSYKLSRRDYLLGLDALHQEKILSVINEVIGQVKLKNFG